MGEFSSISWCDHTFNYWVGCQKVSPACDNCYAEAWAKRAGEAPWGSPPRQTSIDNLAKPRRWQRQAEKDGTNPIVFCASLADVFDNRVPRHWRTDFWHLIRETTALRWIILTKRIGNAIDMLPDDWPMPHVGIMATIAN